MRAVASRRSAMRAAGPSGRAWGKGASMETVGMVGVGAMGSAVAEAARPRGVEVVDACMVGVPRVVRAGNLSFVVGGPPELFERARPHLLCMGKQALHVGPLGAGNAAKLIKNLVTGAEALVIH